MKPAELPEKLPGLVNDTAIPTDPGTYCQRRFDTSPRMRRLKRLELDFARSLMGLVGPEARVLDAPCGNGRFVEAFSTAKHLALLDLNPDMLKVLQKNHAPKGPLDLIQASVSALPFADHSFDLCFCMRLFHHVANENLRRQILGELSRVCRKFVAVSFYKTYSLRYLKRVIRGKKPSGYSLPTAKFIASAADVGLKLLRKLPAVSLVEQQQMLLFEKK